MFLREIKTTPVHLMSITLGDQTPFQSAHQFKGYLISQWGVNVPHQTVGGVQFYTRKNKIVAKWDGLAGTGFVIQKTDKVNEEALETQNIEDLWADNADSASWYMNSTQYQVRQIKGSTEYEAFSIVGDQRKPFGKFSAAELNDTLEPIRAGQKPDAEGFTTYIDPLKVQAFKYSGDAVKIMIEKVGARLNNGDYVVRTNDGNNFTYAIEKPSTFEATLTKAK